ncbi:MAG TPA: hypothetical protein VFX13_18405 [Gaiellales bacterium]|nr:hypothetical protein [Gaiellales bacterium]
MARALAAAFLEGEWEPGGMADRARAALGRRPRWLTVVVRETHATYRMRPADAPRALTAAVERSLRDLDAGGRLGRPPRRVPTAVIVAEMGRTRWPVPAAATAADLAALLTSIPASWRGSPTAAGSSAGPRPGCATTATAGWRGRPRRRG